VGVFELDGWEVAVDLEQPVLVEPVDPGQGGGFDVFDGAPGAAAADQFGLEQSDHGFGQRVVQCVADRADRWIDSGVGEAFGERNRDIPRVEFVKRRLSLGWN
jgi:hypothetical protein